MSNEITGQMKHKNKIEFVPMKMNKVNLAKIAKLRCNKRTGNVNF